MTLPLLAVLLLVLAWALIEGDYIFRGKKTISRRLQDWVNANPQLACLATALVGFAFGWLLAHWTQPPT